MLKMNCLNILSMSQILYSHLNFSYRWSKNRLILRNLIFPYFLKVMSFKIHKDVENLDRSQKCILDNLWNTYMK